MQKKIEVEIAQETKKEQPNNFVKETRRQTTEDKVIDLNVDNENAKGTKKEVVETKKNEPTEQKKTY